MQSHLLNFELLLYIANMEKVIWIWEKYCILFDSVLSFTSSTVSDGKLEQELHMGLGSKISRKVQLAKISDILNDVSAILSAIAEEETEDTSGFDSTSDNLHIYDSVNSSYSSTADSNKQETDSLSTLGKQGGLQDTLGI